MRTVTIKRGCRFWKGKYHKRPLLLFSWCSMNCITISLQLKLSVVFEHVAPISILSLKWILTAKWLGLNVFIFFSLTIYFHMFFKTIALMYNANWTWSISDSKVTISPEGVIEKIWSSLRFGTNWNFICSAHTSRRLCSPKT